MVDIIGNIKKQVARTKRQEKIDPSKFSLKVSPTTYVMIKELSKKRKVVSIAGVHKIKASARLDDNEFFLNPNRPKNQRA